MFRLITAIVVMVALSGCAVLDRVEESPMTSQLITDQITLRFIAGSDDPVARAERVRAVVAKVRSHLSGTESYSIAALDEAVRAQINWQSLSVADQALLDYALSKARASLADLIGEGVVDPEQTERVDTLLTWIDNAAARVR